MPCHITICQGPESFERLLARAGLSEREAQAVRSVVLGLTAEQVAPIIGVGASTVGSYRQRAYSKLGVSGRAEFLALPEVAECSGPLEGPGADHAESVSAPGDGTTDWEEDALRKASVQKAAVGGACLGAAASEGEPPSEEVGPNGRPLVVALAVVLAFIGVLLPVMAAVVNPAVDATPARLDSSSSYLDYPQGEVSTAVGKVPNVVGMRADAAAMALAQEGFCPEFVSRASEQQAGKVLEIGAAGSVEELPGGQSSFSWGDGCTGIYEERGGWDGYVTLVVAV